jgi:hypothetical protein
MHGLIFETSICYWQDQPDIFPFTKRREAGLSRHKPPTLPNSTSSRVFRPRSLSHGACHRTSFQSTAFRLAHYRGIQFLARTVETHSGSIQVESIRPSLTPGTLSHCSGTVVSRTDTLTHWGPPRRPKPGLPLTALKPAPYILTSKPRSEPSSVQYRHVYDNIENSSAPKPVLCESGATSLWVQVYDNTRADSHPTLAARAAHLHC